MEKVRAGDAVAIRADTWNSFIDAANFAKAMRQNQLGGRLKSGIGGGVVAVRNGEAETRGRFSALVLADVAVPPSANEDAFVSSPPTFVGRAMTEEREGMPFAILLEPVAKDAIGRGLVLGVTPAKVTILDDGHGYAVPTAGSSTGALESAESGVARILWKAPGTGEQWCLLQLGGAGSGGGGGDRTCMCRVTGGDTASGYQVEVHTDAAEDRSSTESGILYLPDLALRSEIPSGTWIVGHRMLVKATGGSER